MNIGTQKRKAQDAPSVDQPAKRSNTKGPTTKPVHPPADTDEVTEPTFETNVSTTERGRWSETFRTCALH